MTKARTISEVEKIFEDAGCKLLSKDYKNCFSKMRFLCSCGNEDEMVFQNFLKSPVRCCKICVRRHVEKSRRLSYDYVKDYFEKNGCRLLSKEYINDSTKMRFLCSCGKKGETIFATFRSSSVKKCIKCAKKYAGVKKRFTFEYVKDFFEKEGCRLLETEYKTTDIPLKYICSCGNKSKIRFGAFKIGGRCQACGFKKIGGVHRLTFEYVKKFVEDNGCELLSKEYIHSDHVMKYKCSCGKGWECSFGNFQRHIKDGKKTCPECGFARNTGENNHKWNKDRGKIKSNAAFGQKMYKMLKRFFRETKTKKKGHSKNILGYSCQDLMKHIEGHKDWKNLKNSEWHLDHIFPIKAFLDYNVLDASVVNGLDNLQPLSEKENTSKAENYDMSKFEEWLKNKGIEWKK